MALLKMANFELEKYFPNNADGEANTRIVLDYLVRLNQLTRVEERGGFSNDAPHEAASEEYDFLANMVLLACFFYQTSYPVVLTCIVIHTIHFNYYLL
jgi:hypothetical protein